jgi:hypothetical protein
LAAVPGADRSPDPPLTKLQANLVTFGRWPSACIDSSSSKLPPRSRLRHLVSHRIMSQGPRQWMLRVNPKPRETVAQCLSWWSCSSDPHRRIALIGGTFFT